MDIWGFIITLLPIVISPGASFAIALNNTLNYGLKGLMVPIVGTGLGILTHGLLVGIGLTKVIASYQWMMNLIGVLGTLYLLYLAISLIIKGIKTNGQLTNAVNNITIKDAFLANLLNPKAIILYLVVVSQFVGNTPTLMDYITLSLIHIILMSLWLFISCTVLVLCSLSLDIVKMKKYINIGGGILLLIITLKPYLF